MFPILRVHFTSTRREFPKRCHALRMMSPDSQFYFFEIYLSRTLERHILEARIDGRRGRGRPTRRWEQDINDWMDMTTTQAGRLAEDRILFRQKVQEATSRQEIS